MAAVDRDQFDELVADALDGIPGRLADMLDNVVILVEDEPPEDHPHVLGLYEGIPLTARDGWYAGVLPDRITIFRQPILRMCRTPEQVVAKLKAYEALGVDNFFYRALGNIPFALQAQSLRLFIDEVMPAFEDSRYVPVAQAAE